MCVCLFIEECICVFLCVVCFVLLIKINVGWGMDLFLDILEAMDGEV